MEQKYLVEKLSLQAESFQEAFEILSGSKNFEQMIKNFDRLLRGVFLLKNVKMFLRNSAEENWKIISGDVKVEDEDLYLNHTDNNSPIHYYENQKFTASIIYPLSGGSYLGILLGSKLDKTNFIDFDKITLQILLQVFDSAYKSFLNQKKEKELVFNLNEKVFQLNNLIDTGIELSRFDRREILFEFSLERICALTNASSALFIINDEKNPGESNEFIFPPHINPDNVLNSKYKIESGFEFGEKKYRLILSDKETRKGTTSFNEIDELLLSAVCRQVNVVVENEYLQNEIIKKQQIEKELNVAASIQQRIIPKLLPGIEGYEIGGINIPSREVGGDYFDCINLGKDKYAFIIADVAGKGIGAALLVNTLNAALFSYLEFNLPLDDLAFKLNKLIYNSSTPDKFITFFIAVLDLKTGELDTLNAGHNPIYIFRKDNSLEKIEAGGVGLGMFDFNLPFTGQKLILNPGDKLFLYTDGIPEAMNKKSEEYSDERMLKFLQDNSGYPINEFIQHLVNDIKNFTDGAEQSDDITVLYIKRK
ncbi:MAG TPA: PP2C family protein-serine/threonine phosphatase [Ignavibacteriaceae bacterium]|nr:PP2C family protein-serine/threonine phosphatase [Ignavibacteriaceae bacterium]